MFTVGGTDVFLHKYTGTDDGEVEKDQTQIQDLVFMENRDRKYDPDVYNLRGIYSVQDIDFDLSQFGLFLSNDTLFLTVHIKSSVETVGRKIMSGDVIELPHLKDEYAENDFETALKRYYVVEDVSRSAEGFTPTWYPHLYRLKIKQIVDSQEFKDILDKPEDEDLFEGEYDANKTYAAGQVVRLDGVLYEVLQETTGVSPDVLGNEYFQPYTGNSLRDLMSVYNKEKDVTQGIVSEANENTPKSGYETSHLYTLATDEHGRTDIVSADDYGDSTVADDLYNTPAKIGYSGYLIGGDFAPNGANFGSGISFPITAEEGDYFMRTDFMPNRLFRFDGRRWLKVHDVQRTSLNTANPNTLRGSFINDTSSYLYDDKITEDFVRLAQGQTVIDTDIDFQTAPYVNLFVENEVRDGSINLNYVTADYANLITSYDNNGVESIRITLPAPIQKEGLYTITLYNTRQAQRQALSQVLRPRADN